MVKDSRRQQKTGQSLNLQWFALHFLVVLCDLEFASLARLIRCLVLPVTVMQEVVHLPEARRLIKALHLVSHACMFHFELQHLVHVKLRWLKGDNTFAKLSLIFVHFLQIAHPRRLLQSLNRVVGLLAHLIIILLNTESGF